jgi:hypothetical protein
MTLRPWALTLLRPSHHGKRSGVGSCRCHFLCNKGHDGPSLLCEEHLTLQSEWHFFATDQLNRNTTRGSDANSLVI